MALRDVKFATEFLNLKSYQRTYEAARKKLIPCVRIGRQIRFDEEALREFCRNGGTVQIDSDQAEVRNNSKK